MNALNLVVSIPELFNLKKKMPFFQSKIHYLHIHVKLRYTLNYLEPFDSLNYELNFILGYYMYFDM